jgi:hypothetical protein
MRRRRRPSLTRPESTIARKADEFLQRTDAALHPLSFFFLFLPGLLVLHKEAREKEKRKRMQCCVSALEKLISFLEKRMASNPDAVVQAELEDAQNEYGS